MGISLRSRWSALVRAQVLPISERADYLAAELDRLEATSEDAGPIIRAQIGGWLAGLAREVHELRAGMDAAHELLRGAAEPLPVMVGSRPRLAIEVEPDAWERLSQAVERRAAPSIDAVAPDYAELVAALMGTAWLDPTDPREQLVTRFRSRVYLLGVDTVERALAAIDTFAGFDDSHVDGGDHHGQ